ncbi:MAG: hypothetical protein H3C35_10140 [Bacteroidetes bacterium]|nr:hypothetical protein [Bacteroidota bacterium]
MLGKTYIYTIYWQAKEPGQTDSSFHAEYFYKLKEYITSRFNDLKIEIDKKRNEILQKQSQILRGGLAEFLSTPLQSDTYAINKTIVDALSTAIHQSVTHDYPHLHSIGAVSLEPQNIFLDKKGSAGIRSMLMRGKRELKNRGIIFTKNYSHVYSTKFLLSDLDVIPAIKEIALNYVQTLPEESETRFEPRCSNLALYIKHPEEFLESKQFSIQISLEQSTIEDAFYETMAKASTALGISNCAVVASQPLSVIESKLHLTFDADILSLPLNTIFNNFVESDILNEKYFGTSSLLVTRSLM